jgi:hypothetical protein
MFEKYKLVQRSSVTKRLENFGALLSITELTNMAVPVLWGGAGGGGGVCRKSFRDGAAVA